MYTWMHTCLYICAFAGMYTCMHGRQRSMSGDFCYIFFVRQLNLKHASLVRLTDHRGLIGKSLATGFSCGYWDLNLASTFLIHPEVSFHF